MIQEWLEPTIGGGTYKRYCVIFCQDCDNKTKIYSERTPEESRRECLLEWKLRNEKATKKPKHR